MCSLGRWARAWCWVKTSLVCARASRSTCRLRLPNPPLCLMMVSCELDANDVMITLLIISFSFFFLLSSSQDLWISTTTILWQTWMHRFGCVVCLFRVFLSACCIAFPSYLHHYIHLCKKKIASFLFLMTLSKLQHSPTIKKRNKKTFKLQRTHIPSHTVIISSQHHQLTTLPLLSHRRVAERAGSEP